MQGFADVRFLATTLICLVVLWVLSSSRNVPARGWLIGFVALSWGLQAFFVVPAYLNRTGQLQPQQYRELILAATIPTALIGLTAWILLLVYVLRIRSVTSEARKAELRAMFARNLAAGSEHELVELAENAVVSVLGTGRDITQVAARAQNLTGHHLRVVVSPGTCFTSSGAHQNMVAIETSRFELQPNATENISMRAACVNAARPIPGEADQFHGVHRVSPMLTKFLEHATDLSPMARQAGVWAITDNYSAADVQSHLVTRDREGDQRSAVSDADIAEARKVLGRIGAVHRL